MLDKAQVEQLTQAVNQAKDNLHGDQKLRPITTCGY